MNGIPLSSNRASGLFAGAALAIYGAVFATARAHSAALNAGPVGLGAAFDLMVTVPLVFYFVLVRPGHARGWAVLAVTMAGARATGWILSPAEQIWLPSLRWIGVPCEIWVLVNLARGRRYGWAGRMAAAEVAV